MIALVVDEHLRFVFEAAEGGGMDDAVAVALVGRAHGAFRLGVEAAARGCDGKWGELLHKAVNLMGARGGRKRLSLFSLGFLRDALACTENCASSAPTDNSLVTRARWICT